MINILVTGVGAIIGYGITRTLKSLDLPICVTGVDIFPHAVGQYWCDSFESVVKTNDLEYSNCILKVIKKHRINVILPAIEQDVLWFSRNRSLFEDQGIKCILNKADLIELCQDKWLFYKHIEEGGQKIIPSSLSDNFSELISNLGCPFLIKPRTSYASKGIEIIKSEDQFSAFSQKMGHKYLAQKLIGDDDHEYTASTFGYGDGTCSSKIVMRRYLHQAGSTDRIEIVTEPELEKNIDALSQFLKPLGPTNFQYRLHEGHFYLLEINPRFSSSNSLRAKFGFNEALMSLKFYLENEKMQNIDLKFGKAIRYFEDIVVYE